MSDPTAGAKMKSMSPSDDKKKKEKNPELTSLTHTLLRVILMTTFISVVYSDKDECSCYFRLEKVSLSVMKCIRLKFSSFDCIAF